MKRNHCLFLIAWNNSNFVEKAKAFKNFSDKITADKQNEMGTCKNQVLKQKSLANLGFFQHFRICITAFHITGKNNFEADFKSWRKHKDKEWMLNPKVFIRFNFRYIFCNTHIIWIIFKDARPRGKIYRCFYSWLASLFVLSFPSF